MTPINVNNIIRAWSTKVGWKGETIKINGKEVEAIET
jgi:hypothetical protein